MIAIFQALTRASVGAILIAHGASLLASAPETAVALAESNAPFSAVIVLRIAAAGAVIGGALLIAGLFTRLAAATQIPIVVGTLVATSARGLSAPTFELAMFLLVLLVGCALAGGGRFSVDERFRKRAVDATAGLGAFPFADYAAYGEVSMSAVDLDPLVEIGEVDVADTTTITDVRGVDLSTYEEAAAESSVPASTEPT